MPPFPGPRRSSPWANLDPWLEHPPSATRLRSLDAQAPPADFCSLSTRPAVTSASIRSSSWCRRSDTEQHEHPKAPRRPRSRRSEDPALTARRAPLQLPSGIRCHRPVLTRVGIPSQRRSGQGPTSDDSREESRLPRNRIPSTVSAPRLSEKDLPRYDPPTGVPNRRETPFDTGPTWLTLTG